jgi:hypothetical protein
MADLQTGTLRWRREPCRASSTVGCAAASLTEHVLKNDRFSVVIEKDKDGYFAFCPELQGCYTQGDTYEEAQENVEDAILQPEF